MADVGNDVETFGLRLGAQPARLVRLGHMSRRCRGSVMMEVVLVLPIVLGLLSLMFYFGRDAVRLQAASVMVRYEAWRHEAEGPGPNSNTALNSMFYSGRASSMERQTANMFPDDAPALLHEWSRAYDDAAGEYGEALYAALPRGVRLRLEVTHSEPTALWQRMAGPIRQTHTRFGNDWRFANGLHESEIEDGDWPWMPAGSRVTNTRVLRDVFFADFDNHLDDLAGGDDDDVPLARTIRGFYLYPSGYRGPDIRVHDWDMVE